MAGGKAHFKVHQLVEAQIAGGGRSHRRRRSAALLAVPALAALALWGSRLSFAQTGAGSREAGEPAGRRQVLAAAAGGLLSVLGEPRAAQADGNAEAKNLPAIDKKRQKCRYLSSDMGQANAARDSLFDLRECKMAGQTVSGFDISGVLMDRGDFSNSSFKETSMSKAIARNASFDNVDFTRAIADRTNFEGSSFRGAIFQSTLLTGSTFKGADVTGADFSDAIIDQFGVRPLCNNPTMKGTNPITKADTYESAGCYAQR